MKIVLVTLAALAALAGIMVVVMVVLGIHSRSLSPPERSGGRLPPCPASPNCVSSEYPDDAAHYIAPLQMPENLEPAMVMTRLEAGVRELGGRVQVASQDYLAATFSSRLFGFVDDLQLRPDPGRRVIHVRSAARVGHGDLGVNRRRVERLRHAWRQAPTQRVEAD
ncbi:MAG TPA: DUF1499 domain-containing protein [Thiohalobacter sp.]|nr:DUF1499 domain-containing protein [Thiohalobacter sp.]